VYIRGIIFRAIVRQLRAVAGSSKLKSATKFDHYLVSDINARCEFPAEDDVAFPLATFAEQFDLNDASDQGIMKNGATLAALLVVGDLKFNSLFLAYDKAITEKNGTHAHNLLITVMRDLDPNDVILNDDKETVTIDEWKIEANKTLQELERAEHPTLKALTDDINANVVNPKDCERFVEHFNLWAPTSHVKVEANLKRDGNKTLIELDPR
jgi:hypothetical protein